MYIKTIFKSREFNLLGRFDETKLIERADDGMGQLYDFHRLHSLIIQKRDIDAPEFLFDLNNKAVNYYLQARLNLQPGQTEKEIILPSTWDVTENRWQFNITPLNPIVGLPGSVANPTLKTSGGTATPGTSATTASISVTEGDEVLIYQAMTTGGGAGSPTTPSDSFGDTGGTAWASAASIVSGDSACAWWYRRIGASPSASTITLNSDATDNRWSWAVCTVTGQHSTTPISEVVTDGYSGAANLTVGNLGGMAAGNLAICGAVCLNSTNNSPDADFTELVEVSSGGSAQARSTVQYDPNDDEVQATTSFSVNNWHCGAMLEIAQAAAGGGFAHSQAVIVG